MNIGLRTPTIQLLRDGMYRLCEAYMNGAIDRSRYTVLINRYQQMMIGLVAIEQLTGVVRTSQNRISAGEASTNASMAAQRIDAIAQARHIEQQITAINSRLREIGSPPDAADGEAQSVRNARAEHSRLTAQLAVWTTSLDAQNKAIATLSMQPAEQPSTTNAHTGEGASGAGNDPSESNDNISSEIAQTVYWITNEITTGNLSEFACLPAYESLFPDPSQTAASAAAAQARGSDTLREKAIASCLGQSSAEAEQIMQDQQTRASQSGEPASEGQGTHTPHVLRRKGADGF
jgi:hypothetical protein